MSAGRLYDKLGNKAKAKIVFVIPGGAICKITKTGLEDIEAYCENTEEVISKEDE